MVQSDNKLKDIVGQSEPVRLKITKMATMMNSKHTDMLYTMNKNCWCYSSPKNSPSRDLYICKFLIPNKAQQNLLKE